jgi:hypothetical protein
VSGSVTSWASGQVHMGAARSEGEWRSQRSSALAWPSPCRSPKALTKMRSCGL